jgi:hypothetical protein
MFGDDSDAALMEIARQPFKSSFGCPNLDVRDSGTPGEGVMAEWMLRFHTVQRNKKPLIPGQPDEAADIGGVSHMNAMLGYFHANHSVSGSLEATDHAQDSLPVEAYGRSKRHIDKTWRYRRMLRCPYEVKNDLDIQ